MNSSLRITKNEEIIFAIQKTGTLLCVSDKPLHGEIKLPGQANRFYEEAIAAHLAIGTTACELLRKEGPRLHSRKLRAFNEPPFR